MPDRGGNTFRRATSVRLAASRTIIKDAIGGKDRNDFYAFRSPSSTGSSFNFNLTGKRPPTGISVQLLDSQGQVIQQAIGNKNKTLISRTLDNGTYYLRIYPNRAQKSAQYQLSLSAVPLPDRPVPDVLLPDRLVPDVPLPDRPVPDVLLPNRPVPTLFINNVSISEGDRGITNAVFTVSLSASTQQPVTVRHATQDGTATAGVNYSAATGTLSFAPNQTTQSISIAVAGNRLFELDKTFSVNLFGATNATIATESGVATILNDDIQRQFFDYGDALQKSFLFYEAQRSGNLPVTNRISWRGDSALTDGSDVDVDLAGGYYDAGDHVKFGFPMAGSMTMLSWSAIQYRDAYQQSGQLPFVLDAIKWGTDYILKAHTASNELWAQVGTGELDHAYWGSAETMTMARPAFKIDAENPGSDLAGESAAALAAASIAFRPTDAAYANRLLENAQQLFSFAETYRGIYSDSIPAAATYYKSYDDVDELSWSAIWLHQAIEAQGESDTAYLHKAMSYFPGIDPMRTQTWDDKAYGAAILLAQQTNQALYRYQIETWLNTWSDKSGAGVAYTPGGLAWLEPGGALRYSANTAFLAGIYADTVNNPDRRYSDFAEAQISYILGDNPNQRSYMIGFGNNPPQNPHHRGSHGSTTNDIDDPATNRYPLIGAIVGGPTVADDQAYTDDRTNFLENEVTLDYNAGFTGALARMYQEFVTPSLWT